MRRLALLALLTLPLWNFTLVNFEIQTARVRWDVFYLGQAANPGAPFSNPFNASASAGSISYGEARWRMSGMECLVWGGGTDDGGAGDGFVVQVVHEDGGVDCTCDLGTVCNGGAQTSCTCAGFTALTELQGTEWSVKAADAGVNAGCLDNPNTIHCSIDLFR